MLLCISLTFLKERVCQYQMVLDCHRPSVVCRVKCVSSNVFRVNGMPSCSSFVPTWVLKSPTTSRCVCRLVSVGCAFGAGSIFFAGVRLQIPWEVERGFQQSEPLFLDGHSRESWSAVLHTLLMCSVHIWWTSTTVPLHNLLFPVHAQAWPSSVLLSLCSPSRVDRVFELAQLLDELVDPVVARRRACVFLEHYRLCELIVMLRLWSW